MKVYISGKITGDINYMRKFLMVADAVYESGHTPLNPANLPGGMSPADYMRINFAQMDSADAIIFLPDWKDSRGALLEHLWAEYVGKPRYYIADGVDFLDDCQKLSRAMREKLK